MKLGIVAKVQGGNAFKSQDFQSEGVPIIRIGNLDGKNVEIDNDVCYPIEFWDKHPEFRVEKNNILIAMSGARVGKIGLYESDEKALLNQRVCILKPDENIVTNEYLYFFCLSPTFKNSIKENAFGCAQPNISGAQICDFEINVPDIEVQRKWVNQLRIIKNIIDRREKELEELDNLIKSRFVEMFGDENNSLGWNIVNVEEVADVQVGVVIKPAQYYTDSKNGIKTFRSLNVGPMHIKDNEWVYFTEEGNNKNAKSILKENDLLIVRSGAPGTACVVPKEYEGCNAIDIIIAHPYIDRVNPYYLCAYTNLPHGKKQIEEGTGGAAQQHFNVGKYNKLKLMLPPIEKQEEFVVFMNQVDKLKFEVQKSLEETQQLMNSLMQKYFG